MSIRRRTTSGQTVSLRRPSRRSLVTSIIALLIALVSYLDHRHLAATSPRVAAHAVDKQVGTVTHVVDGDTIDVIVKADDPPVRVRLLGIDAPEVEGASRTFGLASFEYAKARCEGQQVTLKLDELQRDHDKYDRLLAYVYLSNNEILNESLVRDGMAFSHRLLRCDLSAQFDAAENDARKAKRGLWKTITTAQMPEWRREWMAKSGITQP